MNDIKGMSRGSFGGGNNSDLAAAGHTASSGFYDDSTALGGITTAAFQKNLRDIKMNSITLKSMSSNKEVINVSSKLAKAIDEVVTHLREKNFYNPNKQPNSQLVDAAKAINGALKRGNTKTSTGKPIEGYKEHITNLVEAIAPTTEQEKAAAIRRAQRKLRRARRRYGSAAGQTTRHSAEGGATTTFPGGQATSINSPNADTFQQAAFNVGQQQHPTSQPGSAISMSRGGFKSDEDMCEHDMSSESSASREHCSPNKRFTQNVKFMYDAQQINEDQNLKRLNEIRRKRQHEEFLKEHPYANQNSIDNNNVFQGLSKWLNTQIKTIKHKEIKEVQKRQEGTVVMANTKGEIQQFKVPADLRHIVDQKKMIKRSLNIRMMQRLPKKRIITLESLEEQYHRQFSHEPKEQITTPSVIDNQQPSNQRKVQAYSKLKQKIAESVMALRKIKNGQQFMDCSFISEGSSIPFLSNHDLQEKVKRYLKSGDIFIPRIQPFPSPSKRAESFMVGGSSKKQGQMLQSFELSNPTSMNHSPTNRVTQQIAKSIHKKVFATHGSIDLKQPSAILPTTNLQSTTESSTNHLTAAIIVNSNHFQTLQHSVNQAGGLLTSLASGEQQKLQRKDNIHKVKQQQLKQLSPFKRSLVATGQSVVTATASNIISPNSRNTNNQMQDSLLNLPLLSGTNNNRKDSQGQCTPELEDEISSPFHKFHALKDLNQLEPICLTDRKISKSLERKLLYPRNPTFNMEGDGASKLGGATTAKNKKGRNTTLDVIHENPAMTKQQTASSKAGKTHQQLPSLLEFCHQKNIPFCDNEKRFYDMMKNKQNFKFWVDNWKKYCSQNIIDPPPKPKEEAKGGLTNNFLKALMAMAKRNAEEKAAQEASAEAAQTSNQQSKHASPSRNPDETHQQRQSTMGSTGKRFHSPSTSKQSKVFHHQSYSMKMSPLHQRQSVMLPTSPKTPLKKDASHWARRQTIALPSSSRQMLQSPKQSSQQVDKEQQRVQNNYKTKLRLEKQLEQPLNVQQLKKTNYKINIELSQFTSEGAIVTPRTQELIDKLNPKADGKSKQSNNLEVKNNDGNNEGDETKKKKRRRRRRRALPNYYEKLDHRKTDINEKLLKILERVELDRPILFKEKFEVLWNMDKQTAETDSIQHEINKHKAIRHQQNMQMAEKYKLLLAYIHTRYLNSVTGIPKALNQTLDTAHQIKKTGTIEASVKPSECERRFMDFIRIIIEGGWVVQDKNEWVLILDFLEIGDEIENDKQAKEFFTYVAKLYEFQEEFMQNFLICEEDCDIYEEDD